MRKIIILLIVAQLFFVSPAFAHRPETGDPLDVISIKNAQTSFAFYQELTEEAPQHIFKLYMERGDFFHAGINIPQLKGLEKFGVSMALVGPGLPQENSFIVRDLIDLDTLGVDFGVEVVNSADTGDFFEPFTQTEYWGGQVLDLNAPSSGDYYIVVWNPEGESGKYVLDTGTKEVFGILDFFLFPKWWLDAQIYFGNTGRIFILIAGVVFLGVGMIFLRKRDNTQFFRLV